MNRVRFIWSVAVPAACCFAWAGGASAIEPSTSPEPTKFSEGTTPLAASPFESAYDNNQAVFEHNYNHDPSTVLIADRRYDGDYHAANDRYSPNRPYPRDRDHYDHRRWGRDRDHWDHHDNRVWVAGYYEWRNQQVYVPEQYVTKQVPAEYRTVRRHGTWVQEMVEPPRSVRVLVPAHYETRQVKVWVPGYWAYRG